MGLGMSLSSHIALVLFSTLVIWIRVLPFHKRVCLTNLKNMLAMLVPLAEFSVIRENNDPTKACGKTLLDILKAI